MTGLARFSRQRLARALLCAAALLPATAFAVDIRPVVAPDGRTMFELHFLQSADYPAEYRPSWYLSESQKARMVETMERWAQTLRTPGDARTGIIEVATVDAPTAYASSDSIISERGLITRLQAALQGEPDDPGFAPDDAHASIVLGTYPIDQGLHEPSQQPIQATGFDLATIAFHELAHGLGLISQISASRDGSGSHPTQPVFKSQPSLWNSMLRDDHGRPGQPGAPVLCAACDTPIQEGAFDVRQNRGYLTGPHINEVLGDALPGIPVSMLYPNGSLDSDNMSHLELANSLMSHQYFRNYTGFMEAELALMQDLGYDLDRRRLYGRSVYGSGLALDNSHGFHARNPEGTAYLPGTYSTATLGMGLHVYGSRNRITQSADLLTQGGGAVGIRIDGRENHITIPAGVKVHGDGRHGSGVQFAYGRDHTLATAGDIRASGENGVGIRIDFGNNAFSNERMVRGSYLLCDGNIDTDPCLSPWQSNQPIPDELTGPLVSRLDVTGAVAGRHAAIAASATGLVGDIHLMRGARIEGDIRSDYSQLDEQGRLRLTRLTLGRMPDAHGRATDAADPAFRFHYAHHLTGDNLSLRLAGGLSVLDGRHTVHDVRVEPDAALAGIGYYRITGPDQAFVNDGLVLPGNRHAPLRIQGDYRQDAGATLAADFDRQGLHNALVVEGTATLDGTLALRALPDWYEPGWQLDAEPVLQAQATQGWYARTMVDLPSPTLRAHLDAAGTGLRLSRADDAYTRLGYTAAALGVGAALDHIVTNAPESMQGLYRQVDFSSADGFEAANMLAQMAPTPYAAWAASQFDAMRLTSDALTRQQNLAATVDRPGWNVIALPFANHARRRLDDDSAFRHYGHGLLIGAEHTSANTPWTFGAHAVFFEQKLKLDSPLVSSGRSEQWQLGLHSRYVPNSRKGVYMLAQIRAGAAHSRVDRTVASTHWQGSSQARWTARSFQAQATAGYQWALSPGTSVGPVAVLDYAWLRQPSLVESGDYGGQLALAGQHHDNLRASMGVRMQWNPSLGEPQAWQGHLQLTRDQTLMGPQFPQEAGFAARPNVSFGTSQALASRGAWRLQGGVAHDTGKLRVTAQVEGQLSTHGQHQLAGQVSVGWRF
ncbi:autotransporter domain-containing protein [Pusillimonas sp.]|uniref:autotransporter outer membrane beta-barrel domain-containing protein n=1 Tax=Pusillimonas sp. TaxID=3040095 RepID=UPI0037C8808C